MSRSRSRLLVGTIALFACGESPGSLEPGALPPDDLAVAAPAITAQDLVRISVEAPGPAEPGAPARVEEDTEEASARIRNARTDVGFYPGEAYAYGRHDFDGHVGRIETTVQVTFEDQHLGGGTAIQERSYWLSFEQTRQVSAYAAVRTDHTCGLAVQGRSMHAAWIQTVAITSAPIWGRAEETSGAGPLSQIACGRRIDNEDPTGTHTEANGIVCMYLITYDLDTLEVLRVELLSCTSKYGEEA